LPTSSDAALRCEGLGKSYRLGEELSLQHTLRTLVGRAEQPDRLWALRDVTFEVERGSFFGIVGSNGSGKSTLTQLISSIAVPDEGSVRIRGRVLPLLEVGNGFHEDLTGRENVELLGTVLGLSGPEITAELPRIVDFAGVERHLETPLKRYSSGMQARLSFATAVCFPADIYVFDEVLAVVDDDFRDRCVAELRELNEAGRTVIFMSHDLPLVATLCSSGMWLEQGQVRHVGEMDEVARRYEASHQGPIGETA
jgi:ABC-type polysaccharide/polyol phosphate transport system ATPase subunit